MQHLETHPDRIWHTRDTFAPAAPASLDGVPRLTRFGDAAQTVRGFGGCFNELGARALAGLPEAAQADILADLFGPDGCGFNFCRLPIGASDYAIEWYSHHEHDGDFALERFSIERDRVWLLPYLQKALTLRPDMTLFASPWSPPVWMKEPRRYNGGSLRDDPKVHRAYAEYLLRFVQTYRELGIEITQVHVQNEPNSDQKFPSCLWTSASMRDFIRDHLGPRFAEAGEACEIWAGTIERGVRLGWEEDSWKNHTYKDWAHTILADADARRYVAGIGYQWNGKGALAETYASWPDLPIIQTENECGDGNNCWDYAFYVFQLMWDYFNHGTVAYVYWNMILPPGGHSTWGWEQNTLITIDADTQAVTYNPEYFVMKHFAHAIRPGAKFLPMRGHHGAFSLLFENSDGQLVLVAANPTPEDTTVQLDLPGLPESIHLRGRTLNTIRS